MNKFLSWLHWLVIAVLAVTFVAYGVARIVAPRYLTQAPALIEQMSGEYLNGEIKLKSVEWNGLLTLTAKEVRVFDAKSQCVAEVPALKLKLAPWQALFNVKKVLAGIELEQPLVRLQMDKADNWNLRDLLKPSDSDETPFYGYLSINDGEAVVTTPFGTWNFGISAEADGAANPDFAVSARVKHGAETLRLVGMVDTKMNGRLNLKSERFTLTPFAKIAQNYLPLEAFSGAIDNLDLLWTNIDGVSALAGNGELSAVGGKYRVNDNLVTVQLTGGFTFDKESAQLHNMLIALDGQEVKADGSVNFADREAMYGHGLIEAAKLTYAGQSMQNLKLPFRIRQSKIELKDAGFDIGVGHAKLAGSYDINNGALDATMVAHKLENMIIPGRPLDKVALDGRIAAKGIVTTDGKIDVNVAGNTMRLGWRDLKLHHVDFDATVTEKGIVLHNAAAFSDGGAFNLRAQIDFGGNLQGAGRMLDFPMEPFIKAFGYEGSATMSAGFSFDGSLDNFDFAAKTQIKELQAAGFYFPEGHGTIQMTDSVLTLHDYTLTMSQGKNLVNGTVDLSGDEIVLDLRVTTEGVRAEPVVAVLYPELKLTGNVDNQLHISGPFSHLHIQGEVNLTDGSVEDVLLDSAKGVYTYDNGALVIKDGYIKALSTEIDVDGTMDAAQNLRFDLDVKNMDLNNLPIREEVVAIKGFLDAHGSVRGTVAAPTFMGNVTSRQITVNGEPLNNIEGTLTADGKHHNDLQCSFEQEPDGRFSAQLSVDMVEKSVTGNVAFIYGNLRSILAMSRQPLDIDGTARGRLKINPQGKGSGIFADMDIENITVKGLHYDSMRFAGRLQKNIMHIEELKVFENADVTDKGFVAADGWVDFANKKMQMELGAVAVNPAIATAFMANPIELGGIFNAVVQLDGPFDKLRGNASIELLQGSLVGMNFDSFTAMAALEDDKLTLEQALITKDIYKLSSHGVVPVDLFRAKADRHNPNATMNIRIDLENTRLGILQTLSPQVEWGVGEMQGEVILKGTLEEPLIYGNISLQDGSVKLKAMQTVFDKINADLRFNGNEIQLRKFNVEMGKGNIDASGSYALRADEAHAYGVQVKVNNAELASNIFTGRINGDMVVSPQRYFIRPQTADGAPAVTHERHFGHRPFIKADIRLDDVLLDLPVLPEFGEGSSNLGLDVTVTLGPKIHLYNKYLYDIWLAGGLHIKGSTVYTNIDGNLKINKGTVSYLRTPFKIKNASCGWPVPGSIWPTVNLEANAKFRRYDIAMHVTGPVEEMDLQLTSNPSLTKDQIVRMLTLRREVGGNSVTGDDLQNLMSVGLEMTVLGDVEEIFKQALGLDEFRIYSGKLRSGVQIDTQRSMDLSREEKEQYNLLVSKYLTDSWMVGYTTSTDNEHQSMFAQYEISKHFSINYARNKDVNTNENWYGIEYKITF